MTHKLWEYAILFANLYLQLSLLKVDNFGIYIFIENYKPKKDFEEFVIMMASTINNFEDDDEIDEIFRFICHRIQEN